VLRAPVETDELTFNVTFTHKHVTLISKMVPAFTPRPSQPARQLRFVQF
jgi:hypothetical protein